MVFTRQVIGTLLVMVLLIFIFKQCGKAAHAETTHETHGASAQHEAGAKVNEPKATAHEEHARETLKVELPGGVTLDAYKGGIEDRLVGFLKTDWTTLGADSLKNVWFDFDNLNFETGKASITAESQSQVKNIAAILNAFPKAKFKIGGYTDKTGDAAANKKLSQERADAVLAAISGAGAKAAQLAGAEGYGSEFAKVAASASDEERKADRRIAISVRE